MSKYYDIPYNIEEVNIVWPTFTPVISDKHGVKGEIGEQGEQHAINHLAQLLKPELIINCGLSPTYQLMGIDLIVKVSNNIITFDVKAGKSSLYWDTNHSEWYITFNDSFFLQRKKCDCFFHTGVKGDLYAFYSFRQMKKWYSERKHLTGLLNPQKLKSGTTQYKIYKRHWPSFIRSNLDKNRT